MDINAASYGTRAECVAAFVPANFDIVLQLGYYSAGDRGAGTFRRVATMPSHGGAFQSADGAYWEICDNHINVRALGAKGDGVCDDLDAFNTAYLVICHQQVSSSAPAVGGVIYIPWGNYKLRASWNLTNSNKWCEVYGDGFYRTRIFNSNTTPSDTIYCGSSIFQSQYYNFHDFSIDAPAANGIGSTGINVSNNGGVIFERVYVNGTRIGINLISSFACVLDKCMIANTLGPAIYGSQKSFNAINITSCWVFSCGVATSDGAIKSTEAYGIDIHADVEGCFISYQFENCSAITIKGDSEPKLGGQHFSFSGTNHGVNINNMMLAPEANINQWIDNVIGMSINSCLIFNTSFAFGPNAFNVSIGINNLQGSASIAEPPYFAPVLVNSWVNASGYQSASFKKTADGFVKLRGTIANGVIAQAAFVLPAGYRPSQKLRFTAATDGAVGVVVVNNDGTVTPTVFTNTISLDQIQFTAGSQ